MTANDEIFLQNWFFNLLFCETEILGALQIAFQDYFKGRTTYILLVFINIASPFCHPLKIRWDYIAWDEG
jgi:hypothetical protein